MKTLSASVSLLAVLSLGPACSHNAAAPAEPSPPTGASSAGASAAPVDSTTPVDTSAASAAVTPPAAEAAVASAAPVATDTAPSAAAPGPVASDAPPREGPHHGPGAHAADKTASAEPAAGGYTGPDACETTHFHYTQVAGACRAGGRRAVKDVMRGAVKKAKAAGNDVQCTSCHEEMQSFHLKSNAVGDLKKWL